MQMILIIRVSDPKLSFRWNFMFKLIGWGKYTHLWNAVLYCSGIPYIVNKDFLSFGLCFSTIWNGNKCKKSTSRICAGPHFPAGMKLKLLSLLLICLGAVFSYNTLILFASIVRKQIVKPVLCRHFPLPSHKNFIWQMHFSSIDSLCDKMW